LCLLILSGILLLLLLLLILVVGRRDLERVRFVTATGLAGVVVVVVVVVVVLGGGVVVVVVVDVVVVVVVVVVVLLLSTSAKCKLNFSSFKGKKNNMAFFITFGLEKSFKPMGLKFPLKPTRSTGL